MSVCLLRLSAIIFMETTQKIIKGYVNIILGTINCLSLICCVDFKHKSIKRSRSIQPCHRWHEANDMRIIL